MAGGGGQSVPRRTIGVSNNLGLSSVPFWYSDGNADRRGRGTDQSHAAGDRRERDRRDLRSRTAVDVGHCCPIIPTSPLERAAFNIAAKRSHSRSFSTESTRSIGNRAAEASDGL